MNAELLMLVIPFDLYTNSRCQRQFIQFSSFLGMTNICKSIEFMIYSN